MQKGKLECSVGNLKVGKDTIILNITSATDCMSLKKGLCQVPDGKCYALRAEMQYPDVLPYRRRQTTIWDALSAEEIADTVREFAEKKHKIPIKYLRLQEAGDFRTQADIDKANRIAHLLRGVVRVYTYSARKDLDFSNLDPNFVVNGSNWMATNNFKVVPNEESFDPKLPKCRGIAGGGCYGCYLCKTPGHKVIQELLRAGGSPKKKVTPTRTLERAGDVTDLMTVTADVPVKSAKKVRYGVSPKLKKSKKSDPLDDILSVGSSAAHN